MGGIGCPLARHLERPKAAGLDRGWPDTAYEAVKSLMLLKSRSKSIGLVT